MERFESKNAEFPIPTKASRGVKDEDLLQKIGLCNNSHNHRNT